MQAAHDISHVGFTKESDTQKRTFRTQHDTSPKTFISPLENHLAPQKPRFSLLLHAETSCSPPADSLLTKHTPLLPHSLPPSV